MRRMATCWLTASKEMDPQPTATKNWNLSQPHELGRKFMNLKPLASDEFRAIITETLILALWNLSREPGPAFPGLLNRKRCCFKAPKFTVRKLIQSPFYRWENWAIKKKNTVGRQHAKREKRKWKGFQLATFIYVTFNFSLRPHI